MSRLLTTNPGASGLAFETWVPEPPPIRVPHSSQPHRDEWVIAKGDRTLKSPFLSFPREISHREFQSWSIAFLDTSTHHPPRLVDYHRNLPTLSDSSTRASRYLRFFQQGLCRQPPSSNRPASVTLS